MTYLNWGCDPLAGECESCLDAYCNICNDKFKRKHRESEFSDISCEAGPDADEPDCDRCDLESKPDCAHCEIVFAVCRNCVEFASCEFKIVGDE